MLELPFRNVATNYVGISLLYVASSYFACCYYFVFMLWTVSLDVAMVVLALGHVAIIYTPKHVLGRSSGSGEDSPRAHVPGDDNNENKVQKIMMLHATSINIVAGIFPISIKKALQSASDASVQIGRLGASSSDYLLVRGTEQLLFFLVIVQLG